MTQLSLSLKDRLAAGGAINGWCGMPSAVAAEIMARAGFDMLTLDLQHGLIDYQMALTMLQAAQPAVPVLARVAWNEPGGLMKMLDAGVAGVICPMVNTEDDARRLAAWCRYAPLGSRSFGPARASLVYGPDYAKAANDRVVVLAMIETHEALGNLDAILAVPGLDGVYVGPADLGLSLGYEPTLEPKAEEVRTAIATIGARARAAGRIAGCHCGSPEMLKWTAAGGFHFGSLLTDTRIFATALATLLGACRDESAETVRSY